MELTRPRRQLFTVVPNGPWHLPPCHPLPYGTRKLPDHMRAAIREDTITAAIAGFLDNPGRIHSEAAFAALCGVSTVDCSSGKQARHRLNRGGDRQANSALRRIAVTRLRHDPRTQDYYARRVAAGKTRKEIIRELKRYLAREACRKLIRPGFIQAPVIPSGKAA